MPKDEATGFDIVINAIEKPFYQILYNAGYEQDNIGNIEEDIKNKASFWQGYNPRIEEYVDMFHQGIIDPTKVTRLALENAASVAGTMLVTETVVSNIKSKDNPAMDPSMMM